MGYGVDRWYWPITLTSLNNQFVLEETTGGAGSMTVTVTAGTYYLHNDTTLNGNGYPSLWKAISAGLVTAGANNTYGFQPITPTSSTAQTFGGVRIFALTGSDSYTVKFADAAFTMENAWFGYGLSASNANHGVGEPWIDPPYTSKGFWQSATLTGNTASDKRSDVMREIVESSDRTSDVYQVEWNEDTVRTMRYEYVPAAHIWPDRAADASYASTASLATNDIHNAFYDVWDVGSRLGVIVIVHDEGNQDLEVVTHDYEIVKFADAAQRKSFRKCVKMMVTSGEFYELSVDLYKVSGTYSH